MNDLYFLIHSLSANEKRYVTLYINRFSNTKNNYSNLFNTISKDINCNDDVIIKKHRKDAFIQNLSVTKHYLFKIILNAMCEYFDEQFIDWKLRNQLSHIFVLTSKGLDKTAHKMMLKTKEEAAKYENYYILLEVINHERWLYGNRRIMQKDKNYGIQLCNEEKSIYDILNKLHQYREIWHQLNSVELSQHQMDNTTYINKIHDIVNVDALKEIPTSDSFTIKTWYFSCLAHYYTLIDDAEQHLKYYKEVILLRENQFASNPSAPIDLFAIFYNYMLACYKSKNWEELKIYLDKILQVEAKTIEKKIKLFHDYYHCKLLYLLGTEEYIDIDLVLNEVKKGLALYQERIRTDFLILILQCSGLLCLFNKRYKEANAWWQNVVHIEKTNIEIKTQCAVHIYMLMLSVDEQDYDVLEYQINTATKFLKDNNQYNKSEELLLKSFKKISKNKNKQKVYFSDVYHEISNINKGNLVTIIDDFILKWLNQKLN